MRRSERQAITAKLHATYLRYLFHQGHDPYLVGDSRMFFEMADDVLRTRVRGHRRKAPIVDYCRYLELNLHEAAGFKFVTLRKRYLLARGLSREEVASIARTLGGHDLPEVIMGGRGADKSLLDGYADYLEAEIVGQVRAHRRKSSPNETDRLGSHETGQQR